MMKPCTRVSGPLILAMLVVAPLSCDSDTDPDGAGDGVEGNWAYASSIQTGNGEYGCHGTVTLAQDGTAVTGTASGRFAGSVHGTASGASVTLSFTLSCAGNPVVTWSCTRSANDMSCVLSGGYCEGLSIYQGSGTMHRD